MKKVVAPNKPMIDAPTAAPLSLEAALEWVEVGEPLAPVGLPEPVVVAGMESVAGLTEEVVPTVTVAVPTSTVKYEPASGALSFAAVTYVVKLERVQSAWFHKVDGVIECT
jgi:hypothetical protein